MMLVIAGAPRLAVAVDFNLERMLSPGPLSQAHAKQETDCASCHGEQKKSSLNEQCLACHEEVGRDIDRSTGFHGKKMGVKTSECKLCHSEHQGVKADIVQLNPHGFDHRLTDFPLTGQHVAVACNQCHGAGDKFRDAPDQCVDCHREKDVHRGSQGEQCANCHATDAWRKTRFDHDKTAFPLSGAHQDVECRQCHRSDNYKQVQTRCSSCHSIDDVHLKSMGEQCDTCHGTSSWTKASFSHATDTDFPLLGAHRSLKCVSCHRPHSVASEQPTTCVGCHRHDDPHFGGNGEQCDQCHNEVSWGKSKFNHDETAFPLTGRHRDARCEQCHQGNVHTPIRNQTCIGCHQLSDVHKKTLGAQCQQCHGTSGWASQVRFDHDLTHFPLLGRHTSVACESCHSNFQFVGIGASCNSCHQSDDVHHGNMDGDCSACHHPTDWKSWRFDHDRQTSFPLLGAHQGLACEGCHDVPMTQVKAGGGQCGRCHQNDDVHRGAYGMQCDTCHGLTDFSTLQMR